ncbi:protease inhibitor I42 family protein [Flavobacterium sp. GCM10027622]|uniref:protease inhibitor I42 family protein n=1 Tax=unclassified Flavobacterium TaxID=196869 RepID=UPI003613FF2F
MNKTIKWFGIITLTVLAVVLTIHFWTTKDYYKPGENGEKNCSIGETFQIELITNGSTGYSNCWINEQHFKHVQLIQSEYHPSWNESLGYVGAGGTMVYTFSAVSKGIDTLKVAACPTAREGKKCSDFNETNTAPHNRFVITVEH